MNYWLLKSEPGNWSWDNQDKYDSMYLESINNNEKFWEDQAERIEWIEKFTKVKNVKYSKKDVSIKWYEDGYLNVTYNCVDRHAKKNSRENCYHLGR